MSRKPPRATARGAAGSSASTSFARADAQARSVFVPAIPIPLGRPPSPHSFRLLLTSSEVLADRSPLAVRVFPEDASAAVAADALPELPVRIATIVDGNAVGPLDLDPLARPSAIYEYPGPVDSVVVRVERALPAATVLAVLQVFADADIYAAYFAVRSRAGDETVPLRPVRLDFEDGGVRAPPGQLAPRLEAVVRPDGISLVSDLGTAFPGCGAFTWDDVVTVPDREGAPDAAALPSCVVTLRAHAPGNLGEFFISATAGVDAQRLGLALAALSGPGEPMRFDSFFPAPSPLLRDPPPDRLRSTVARRADPAPTPFLPDAPPGDEGGERPVVAETAGAAAAHPE